jgi:hypothetical protein
MIDLDKNLQPGKKIRVFYYEGNRNNELRHIRAIVDEKWIVYKVWWPSKQRWHYAVESRYLFEMVNEDGHLQEVK